MLRTTLDLPGCTLNVDDVGPRDAPAIVLLHAGIASRRMWDPIVPHLDGRWRVVSYDLRGFGDARTTDATPFADHDDVAAVLDACGIDAAVLIGASRGGMIAMDTTLAHPERVRALAMVGSCPGGFDDVTQPPEERRLEEDLEALAEAGRWTDLAAAEVRFWAVGPTREPDDVGGAFLAQARALNTVNIVHEGESETAPVIGLDPPAAGRLSEIHDPVLVVVGEHDTSVERTAAAKLETELEHVESHRIPGTAHLPSVERPDEFLRILVPWLERVTGV